MLFFTKHSEVVEQKWNHVLQYTETTRLCCTIVLPDIQTSHPGTCGWLALCLVWPCEDTCSDRVASAQKDTIGHVITSMQERQNKAEQCWITCR